MKEIIQRNLKPILLILAAVVGVLIICFSDGGEDTNKTDSYGNLTELELYAESLEKRLEAVVEAIDGAGDAKVMITLESSFEKIYANNARLEEKGGEAGKTTEKEIVLAGTGASIEEPILLKEMCPKVKGVVVVCSGAGESNVERKIKDAAIALFGVSELKVYVTKS